MNELPTIINKYNVFDNLSDSSLSRPEEDRLGYRHFSNRFARIIGKSNSSESYVIALTGEWGCGKSSVLNMAECYLTKRLGEINLSENEKPLILHFNPWIFSGRDDILKQFFTELLKEFDTKKSELGDIYCELLPFITQLANFGLAVSECLPEYNTKTITKIGSASLLLLMFSLPSHGKKIDKNDKTLQENKKLLIEKAEKLDRKIIIIIDDIDRLTNDEILEFFKAIKAIADFPNIIYVLAFDEMVIRDAIGRKLCQDYSGKIDTECSKKYLEKIIQLPIPFPPPNEILKDKFIEEQLYVVFKNTPHLYKSTEHWNYIKDSVSHFLSTPRRIKRVINSIKLIYPSIENEVNANDLICLETIRQCLPDIYLRIKNNPEYFIYKPSENLLSPGVEKNEHRRFHEEWFAKLNNHDKIPALTLMNNLFPEIRSSIRFPETIFIYEKGGNIQKARIHANMEMFKRYFRLEVENYDYSIHAINVMFAKYFSSTDFTNLLKEYSSEVYTLTNMSKAGVFLNQLGKFIDEYPTNISLDHIKSILITFFNIADDLMLKTDRQQGIYGTYGNSTVIEHLSRGLLLKLDMKSRTEVLKEGFKSGNSISFMSLLLDILHPDYKSNEMPNKIINPVILEENINEFVELFIKKIETVTMINYPDEQYDYNFFKRPLIAFLLNMWEKNYSHKEKIAKYIKDFVNNEAAWINVILESARYEESFNIRTLQEYIPIEDQKDKIQNIINRDNLTQHDRESLETFIKNEDN